MNDVAEKSSGENCKVLWALIRNLNFILKAISLPQATCLR